MLYDVKFRRKRIMRVFFENQATEAVKV